MVVTLQKKGELARDKKETQGESTGILLWTRESYKRPRGVK